MVRRILLIAAVASTGLLALGGAVSAHIDPDPTQAQAGSRVTVGFTVEHGCDGSPTVRLDMRLPDGVTDAVPEPVDGWDGSVEDVDGDTIITFAGGPLADDVEGTFSVTMTLPPTPDTTVYFPFVQRCDAGEIRWIGIPAEPGDELDEPAPAMSLVGPVAVPPTVAPSTAPTTAPSAATTAPGATATTASPATDSSTTTEAAAPTTETPTSEAPTTSEPVLISEVADESGDSGTGTIIFIASIAAVLGLGGLVAYRSRQARAGAAADAN
jgi:uncharacterized protein YcnI